MSDADQAHIARHLKGLEHHAKVIAGVLVALNENFVALVKKIEEWETMTVFDETTETETDKENGHG